jgi:signal transduction histidine kinase
VEIIGIFPLGDFGDDLFKILKELAFNARDHAGADRLTISFEAESVTFVEFASKGKKKFVPLTTTPRKGAEELRGYGITGIEERLIRHGATLFRVQSTGVSTINFPRR